MKNKIIGFTQGTFDMFHIGHLNLIKNAKAKCDYLIIGVNTDELVIEYKNKKPIIPLEERIEIIEAISYVDKVVVTSTLDKYTHYKEYKFQKLFIGDDWKNSERWKKTELEMGKEGVVVEFLPYTKNTSSTLIRKKLEEI